MTSIRQFLSDTRESSWRLSPQVVDPLGTLGTRPVGVVGCLVAFAYAVVVTIIQWADVRNVPAAVGALVVLALACAVFQAAARPVGAPFGARAASAVVALALLAAWLEVLSRLGHNALLQDDFGQVSLAILLAMLAPYRPAMWLVWASVISAIVLAFFPLAQIGFLTVVAPYFEYVVVIAVPPLALGLAGAAFANGIVKAVRDWQRTVSRAVLEIEDEAHVGLARSVQQEQVTLLSRDVLPFLSRGINAQTVDVEDVEVARSLAEALRGSLVAEIGRTWLDDVAAGTLLTTGVPPSVDDPRMLALTMSSEQRVACAAVVAAVCADPRIAASSVIVRVAEVQEGEPGTAAVTVIARVLRPVSRRRVEGSLVQYLAVVRVLFGEVTVDVGPGTVTVGFHYAQS
ncbi:MAG: hypothetical protein ABWY36_03065 [Leifsonia sp.]